MKHIWKVRVYFQEDYEGETIETMEVFNVEAIDDVEARQKGISCAKQQFNEDIEIQYVETNHVLKFED